MSAHTPGPWSVFETVSSGLPIVATPLGPIAHVLMHSYADAFEVNANARLIAAAPDLLEALKVLLNEVEDNRKYIPLHMGSKNTGAPDIARAAIAKVEGK